MSFLPKLPVVGLMLCAFPLLNTQAGTITIGVENIDYLPCYGLRDSNYVGFARDLFDAYGKDTGNTIVYKPLPVKRLLASLLSGDVDAKFPDNEKWAPDARKGATIAYSGNILEYIDGVMVRPDRVGKGVAEIKTLALVQGFTPWDYMDLVNAKKIAVNEVPDYPNLIEFVIRGRADGAYGSVICARFELNKRKANGGELVYDPSLPHSQDFYKMSSVKNPAFIADFDRWLSANAEKVQAMKKEAGVTLE